MAFLIATIMCLLVSLLSVGSAQAAASTAAAVGDPATYLQKIDRGGTENDEFVISSAARWLYRYAETGEFIGQKDTPISTKNALQINLIARSWDDGQEVSIPLDFTNAPVSPVAADAVTFTIGECNAKSFRPVLVNFTNVADDAANSGPSKDRIVVIADSKSLGRKHWDATDMGRWDDGQSRSIAVHSDHGNVLNDTVGYYPGTYQVRIFANGDMATPVATGVAEVNGCGDNPNMDEEESSSMPTADKPGAKLRWLKGGRFYQVKMTRPASNSILRYKVVVRQPGTKLLKRVFVVSAGATPVVKRVVTNRFSPDRPRKAVVSVKVLSRWQPLQKVLYRG